MERVSFPELLPFGDLSWRPDASVRLLLAQRPVAVPWAPEKPGTGGLGKRERQEEIKIGRRGQGLGRCSKDLVLHSLLVRPQGLQGRSAPCVVLEREGPQACRTVKSP